MSKVALTGSDTIIVAGRLLTDLTDQDVVDLDFPNELCQPKTGKNGNTIYAFNYTGLQCKMKLRVLLGSGDDKFLNNLLSLWTQNPPAFTLMTGAFVKVVGDGNGNQNNITYTMTGGVFDKLVPAKENADGDPNQAVAVYSLFFSNAPRNIG